MRISYLFAVVGRNGCGKTTWIKKNIITTNDNLEKNVIVVTPDPIEHDTLPIIKFDKKFQENIYNNTGCKRIIYEDNLQEILLNLHNCSLVLDDCKTYLNNQTPAIMRELYIRRRQRMIDVYFVCHSLRQLPPECFDFLNYLVYFKTNENLKMRKKLIAPNLYEVLERNKKN